MKTRVQCQKKNNPNHNRQKGHSYSYNSAKAVDSQPTGTPPSGPPSGWHRSTSNCPLLQPFHRTKGHRGSSRGGPRPRRSSGRGPWARTSCPARASAARGTPATTAASAPRRPLRLPQWEHLVAGSRPERQKCRFFLKKRETCMQLHRH